MASAYAEFFERFQNGIFRARIEKPTEELLFAYAPDERCLSAKELISDKNSFFEYILKANGFEEKNKVEKLQFVQELLNENNKLIFEFAFSNSEDATNLNYIVSDKDNSQNSIAYVDEELKANFFNSEDTYIWVKTQDKVIIDGEKIVLDYAKTVEELKTIENITNVITVQANAEDEKIKINGEEGIEYYYKVYIAGSYCFG